MLSTSALRQLITPLSAVHATLRTSARQIKTSVTPEGDSGASCLTGELTRAISGDARITTFNGYLHKERQDSSMRQVDNWLQKHEQENLHIIYASQHKSSSNIMIVLSKYSINETYVYTTYVEVCHVIPNASLPPVWLTGAHR